MKIFKDLYYSVKVIRSILSGYRPNSLQVRGPEEGEWLPLNMLDDIDIPYYVCPVFGNGRHIPLPLILDPDNSEFFFQRVILKFFKRCTHLLDNVYYDCQTYVDNRKITLSELTH